MSRVPPPPPNPDLVQCAMCHRQARAVLEFCDVVHVPARQLTGERRIYLMTGNWSIGRPHMHRVCTHCGYEWTENVA